VCSEANVVGFLMIFYCKFTAERVSERVLKIAQHMTKVWSYENGGLFFGPLQPGTFFSL